jgi:Putative adhesin
VKSRSVAIIALTAVTASGCGVGVHFADYRHTVTLADAHIAGPVKSLQVNADAGHVVVTTGSGDGVTVHRVVHYRHGTPHPGQQLTDGTLTFSEGCSRCRVDYDLTVPASVSVRARTGSGRIEVSGVAGDVSAGSDSGSITIEGAGGRLTAGTDSGSIRATGVRSTVATASSDSGSIRLEFAVAPRNVRATNDSGSVRLAVPGGPYNVDVHTDSGGRHIAVPTAPTSPAKLYLRSDSGSVTVAPA